MIPNNINAEKTVHQTSDKVTEDPTCVNSPKDIDIDYKFRPAKQDRRHLIVIFSGFRKKDTYDLSGSSSDSLRANILWIQDRFYDNYSYYLNTHMNDQIERAVFDLIEKFRINLGLNTSDVTVAGFSKGGSAAIYYGLRYNYGAIISVVPQFQIGTYINKHWPTVLQHMTGSGTAKEIDKLDATLTDLISSDQEMMRNIYLFSSEADPQHADQVAPYIDRLTKYSNFNYIETKSPIVDGHSIVSRYNVPLIISILSSITERAVPQFGKVTNGSDAFQSSIRQPTIDDVRKRTEVVESLTRVDIDNDRLFIEGHSFVKGNAAESHSSVRVNLVLDSPEGSRHLSLGTVKDPNLSYLYYEAEYCDYSHAAIATPGFKGINLDAVPLGVSYLKLSVQHGGVQKTVPATSAKSISSWNIVKNDLVKISSSKSGICIIRRSPLGFDSKDTIFNVEELRLESKTIFISGYFIQPGFATPNYNDVSYYIVLSDPKTGDTQYTIPLASDHRAITSSMIDDIWNDYTKSYFATLKYRGVSASHVLPGLYNVRISARFGDSVFSKDTGRTIEFTKDTSEAEKPQIAVFGACVTRDLFNSKLVPKWKDLYTLHSEYYQSSLTSLMSSPVHVSEDEFSDLDRHSRAITMKDFDKSFLKQLAEDSPDIILIDFLADAKYGALKLGESLVTNNKWKLQASDYYSSLNDPLVISMKNNEEEYIEEFRAAAIKFKRFREKSFPSSLIVVNQARATSLYVTTDKIGRFSSKEISSLNLRWEKLEAVFCEVMDVVKISGLSAGLIGDADHPWGPGPLHYQPSYYSKLQEELCGLPGFPEIRGRVVADPVLTS
ncbi:accessory Sec system protein Asp2 [Specibacter sp. NPDC057265]|uniref:accessory Sec system protein Asp2 n=1 Tax=Specibacter sp. NPDC057265 TaxID=3346075 RepID=UPI00364597CD